MRMIVSKSFGEAVLGMQEEPIRNEVKIFHKQSGGKNKNDDKKRAYLLS